MKQLYKNIWNSVEKEHNQNIDKKLNDRVLIIDGLNTFIRCWSSIPTKNDDGEHVGGVTGVLKSIGYAIRNVQPTRVVVVFDGQAQHSVPPCDCEEKRVMIAGNIVAVSSTLFLNLSANPNF